MRSEAKDLGSCAVEGPRGYERTEIQKNWEPNRTEGLRALKRQKVWRYPKGQRMLRSPGSS